MNTPNEETDQVDSFTQESQSRPPSFAVEFLDFLVHNKKWWLAPVMIVLLVFSLFIILTNSAIGPFIYVLF